MTDLHETVDSWRFSRRSRLAGGQPIGDLMNRALANPDLISLAAGFVDQQTLPVELVRQATEIVLSDPAYAAAALQYSSTHGSAQLRGLLRDRLVEMDGEAGAGGAEIAMDQIVLTAGSNQLLHLICDALVDEDDIMLCAAPTYLVFLGIMQNVGGQCWGVGSDDQGMCPDALDAMLSQLDAAGQLDRVKGVYIVSYFDNPAGRTASVERREQLTEVAARWRGQQAEPLVLIEDAAYRQLRYEGEDVASFLAHDPAADHTAYLGTFSKSLSPGLRVGWGVLPAELAAAVIDLKTNLDFGSPHFAQQIVATMLDQQLDLAHVDQLCRQYRTKRDAMLSAMETHIRPIEGAHWTPPEGGLYVWLELPDDIDTGPDSPLWEQALDQGMIYVPGEFCYPQHGAPIATNGMRLSFGVPSCQQIERGIEMLAHAIEKVRG